MRRLVYSGHTGQHPVLITDEITQRSLRFGTEERQSCIDMSEPWVLQLAYTRWMMTALLLCPHPRSILLFGLGGGALPHFLHHHHPQAQLDIVEKEQVVIDLACQYFSLPCQEPVRIFHQDALQFLRYEPYSDYQLAFLDIFGPGVMAEALFDATLYQQILARLTPDGVLAINLWNGEPRLYQRALQAVKEGSQGQLLQLQLTKRSNVILLAFPRQIPWRALKRARKNIPQAMQQYRLDFARYIKRLRRTNRLGMLADLFDRLG